MRRLILTAFALALLWAGPAKADFSEYEVESAEASLSSYQAGAHADFTTSFKVKSEWPGGELAQTRDVVIDLPPGLIGNPNNAPKCTMEELGQDTPSSHCPVATQVGVTLLDLQERSAPVLEPVYNMTTPEGGDVVARFGFMASIAPVTINVRVRSDTDYGVTATVDGAAGLVGLKGASTTIWGVPASPVHDPERVTPEESGNNQGPPNGGRSTGTPPLPFLSNPTRCGVPLQVSISADSYQNPGVFSSKTASLGEIHGCDRVDFKPSFTATPTTREAAAPTGMDIDLKVPQDETPDGRATSQLRNATVVFPEGLTLTAGAADGLQSCSASQVGYESRSAANCPPASKLGTVELDVPALERTIEGAIYQRTPEPEHLFRVWIAADELGAHIALPGEIQLDPQTGRITARFSDNPQVSVREIHLHLFGGPRAPLATPSACGTYLTHWQLDPWSGQQPAAGDSPMTIDANCDAGRFDPQLSAGTVNPRAGSFSPFTLRLTKGSGGQNVSLLSVTLPPGLLAKLAGVPRCEGGEAASGNCPAGSRIGSVNVAAGAGSSPLWIPQAGKSPTAIYLGGPYRGAPFSLVITVPAQAGPFDLGTVTVRSAIRVDPESARVSIDSDPLPQILQGVPISYRVIQAQVDRPNFTLNATGCRTAKVQAHVEGSAGAISNPSAPYQATNCSDLGYSPKLVMGLRGGTRRTQHPALQATLTQPRGQSNSARASVVLPASEFIDQGHISSPCTRVQFNAGACPPGSILGRARAVTPLLKEPLEGPVYFRSNGGARQLPDIVAALRGPFDITVVGFVDSVRKKGSEVSRTRTRFFNLPDAPVSKFTISLFGGKRGLLVNSQNLCAAPRKAQVEFVAQNDKKLRKALALKTSCAHSRSGTK